MDESNLHESDTLSASLAAAILAEAQLGRRAPESPEDFVRLIAVSGAAAEGCIAIQRTSVNQARRLDVPWAIIGEALEISKQAAQQRFAPIADDHLLPKGARVISGATAFNEMSILEREGKAGYHLVGFGALTLFVESSSQTWEHRRKTSLKLAVTRSKMAADGWTYIGSWFPFHYFKRAVA